MSRRAAAAVLAAVLAAGSPAGAGDLKPSAEPPIEVTIVGVAAPPVAAHDPSGASYALGEERLRAPGASAADVLAQVPGVQVARTGGGSELATASIRGATSAETPVYLAGVRLNDDVTGTADLSLVPLWMIRRVEVYRSGAPAEADRLGIGGAIFFEPILPRGPRVGGGLGAGSFGERAIWVAGAAGDARAGAMVALRRQSATNDYPYLDDRGTAFDTRDDRVSTRQNADFVSYDLWSIARLRVGHAAFTVLANGFTRDQGVTGLSVIPAKAARAHVQRGLGAVAAAIPCASGDRCRVEIKTSAIATRSEILDPLRELGALAPRVASAGERLSEEARVRFRLGEAWTVALGASQEFERLSIDEPATADTRARRATTRGSASVVVGVTRRIEVNVLAAVEHHGTSGPRAGGARDVLEPVARAGASLQIADGVRLLANVGRYVRVPTLGETYGISPIVRGNPELVPEHGVVADLGARAAHGWTSASLYADVFGFARFASDLIGFRLSSFGVVRPYNVASARVIGLELDVGARILHHIRAELALTLLDPRDVSPDRSVTSDLLRFQSRVVAVPSIEVYHEDLPALALDRAALGARLSYRTSRVADPAGLVVLPAQAVVDLELSLLFWQRRIAVRVALTDAFDARSPDVVGLPLPGRGAHGSMEVWW